MSIKPAYLPVIQQHDYDQLLEFKKQIIKNCTREPASVLITFKDKRFRSNMGGARIEPLSRSSALMDVLNSNILDSVNEVLEWYKDEQKIG